MTHKIYLVLLAALLGSHSNAQESITFIGQAHTDSTFERGVVLVTIDSHENQRVHIPSDGEFRVALPSESEVVLTIMSETHLTERILIDTHNAFCDPVTRPINERLKMSFALFPTAIAKGMQFDKPFASISFVEGTGRRIVDQNLIEVHPSSMGDYADIIER